MTDDTTLSRPSDAIFQVLGEECRHAVVARALEHKVTRRVRTRLNAGLRRLKLNGFRDTAKAPPRRLLQPVLDAIDRGSDPLASAVLDAWIESREDLRNAASAQLASRGIAVPEPPAARFESFWPADEWTEDCVEMAAADDSLSGEEAMLMLCLLSRRFPGSPPLESELFRGWIGELRELQPNAPEWLEAEAFAKKVYHVRETKLRDLLVWFKGEIARGLEDLRRRFDDDLRYLGIDPDPWPGDVEKRPALAEPTLQFVGTLRDRLEAYQPLRPQAASRDEERQRAVKRQDCEDGILGLLADWQRLRDRPDPPTGAEPETAGAGSEPVADRPPGLTDESLQAELGALQSEHDQALGRLERVREENDRLQEENRGLRSEKTQWDREADRLRGELSRSRRTEEQWRRSYVDEKRRPRSAPDNEPVTLNSVREAVALAQESFPERLLIKPNTKSDENTPFDKPGEVFDALAWLATAYRRAPHDRIAEACPGWFYRPDQSDTTMGRYREWYQVQVDGTTWELSNHIGTGSSHDPRHTIRIAFAWDDANDRVVVGFVGLHQRNRQS